MRNDEKKDFIFSIVFGGLLLATIVALTPSDQEIFEAGAKVEASIAELDAEYEAGRIPHNHYIKHREALMFGLEVEK